LAVSQAECTVVIAIPTGMFGRMVFYPVYGIHLVNPGASLAMQFPGVAVGNKVKSL